MLIDTVEGNSVNGGESDETYCFHYPWPSASFHVAICLIAWLALGSSLGYIQATLISWHSFNLNTAELPLSISISISLSLSLCFFLALCVRSTNFGKYFGHSWDLRAFQWFCLLCCPQMVTEAYPSLFHCVCMGVCDSHWMWVIRSWICEQFFPLYTV